MEVQKGKNQEGDKQMNDDIINSSEKLSLLATGFIFALELCTGKYEDSLFCDFSFFTFYTRAATLVYSYH